MNAAAGERLAIDRVQARPRQVGVARLVGTAGGVGLDVMSVDELTIEASVRLLSVLDAPTVSGGEPSDDEEDAGAADDVLLDAADESAESEAEALAEASGGGNGESPANGEEQSK